MSSPASADLGPARPPSGGELTAATHRTIAIWLAGALTVAAGVLLLRPPGAELVRTGTLVPPYTDAGGLAVSAPVPFAGDTLVAPTTSRLTVFEDGRPLGPPHTIHDTIRAAGGGAFSHWGETVVFSASDASHPNGNGRAYTYRARVLASPLWLVVGTLALGTLAAFGLFLLAVERLPRRVRGALATVGYVALTLAATEVWAWAFLQRAVFEADTAQLRTYAWLSGDTTAERVEGIVGDGMAGTDTVATFAPHPFLNFTLNPTAAYMGEHQFNADYLIRRREAIRARAEVSWRALVLGGSTTFGAGIRHEEDTWVHRLEARLRTDYGSGVDVINGGVGGYSLVDNVLHYTLLLDALRPDVVILFTGINDVHPRLIGDLRPDFRNSRIPWAGGESAFVDALRRVGFLQSVRLFLLRRVKAGAIGHIYSAVQRDYPPPSEWAAALARNGPALYGEHLAFAVSLLTERAARVVVVPQIWKARADHPTDAFFGIGVAEHNAVNEAVARAHHLPFFAHLLDADRFVPGDLFDACHFTVPGHARMADAVFNFLVTEGVVPARRAPE